MMRIALIILFLVLVLSPVACDVESKRFRDAKDYVATRTDLTPERHAAILRGEVLIGMAPDEAIAAAGAGQWKWLVFRQHSKWPDNADPLDMIYEQRLHPDSTYFRLDFANKTQFSTKEPAVFSVCFTNGQAFRISRAEADMCETE
jgi:hypothetical protein